MYGELRTVPIKHLVKLSLEHDFFAFRENLVIVHRNPFSCFNYSIYSYFAVSDLSLHCLLRPVCKNTLGKYTYRTYPQIIGGGLFT